MVSSPRADELIRRSADWNSFWPFLANSGTSRDQAGKTFERLTQLYLQTHPEYRSKLKKVWRLEDVPARVRAQLRLPSSDEGIDLLAETYAGEYWAVQCKFRSDTTSALTYRELSTFTSLAFVSCRGISLAVVAHTCSKPVRKHKLLGNTVEIGLDRWLALGEEGWMAIRAATAGKPAPIKPRLPRPHQVRAIAAAENHFVAGKAARGRLVMPCGTGKSLTAFWIAQKLNPRTVLVAVPSLSLIKQSLTDWTREFLAHGEVPEWLCVCSDESTGKLEQDEFVGTAYDLGVDATTKPDEIAKFLARPSRKRKIIFATYQSGTALAAGTKKARAKIDLAILDEAHRTVGSRDKSFALLVFRSNIDIGRRLFMTATERIVRGANDDVLSMDNAEVYGERFFQMSFKEAINADPPIICDYKILTITVTDQNVRELIEENRHLSVSGTEVAEREAQALASGIALQRAFREHGVRHAISFHRSIRAADDFREQHEQIVRDDDQAIRPACFHVSSHKTTGERADLMREFRESPSALISNARCLQEGVDIPAVDCVLFADPKQSVVDIVQAAGRAMRPYPGKAYGYIVVPVVVPTGQDFAEFAEGTEFKQVARVITALSTQDDRIAEEFRAIASKQRPSSKIVEISGDVPVGYGVSLDELREKVRVRLWNSVGRANWRGFEEARAYVHGLNLKGKSSWSKLLRRSDGNLPPDIPTSPAVVYANAGWKSWGDWLGTGYRRGNWRPFEEARSFTRSLHLGSRKDWKAYVAGKLPGLPRKPEDIPHAPAAAYASNGWLSMPDWLGTNFVPFKDRKYRNFDEARKFVRSLGLRSADEWRAYCDGVLSDKAPLPEDIPRTPRAVYETEWTNLGDWLGTDRIATQNRRYRDFNSAREFVRLLKLRNAKEWFLYVHGALSDKPLRPKDIPARPAKTYRNEGWKSWPDWLGTATSSHKRGNWLTFQEARAFARSLGLKNSSEWQEFCGSTRRPPRIPTNPQVVYRSKGWNGMGDWLGTGNLSPKERRFRPLDDARVFVRSLGLRSTSDWNKYCASGERPPDIPASPDSVYRQEGWIGMSDWLGTGRLTMKRVPHRQFREARAFVRSLGLKSGPEWERYCRSGNKPDDIPASPEYVYRDLGWTGIRDWLGTVGEPFRRKQIRSFSAARTLARGLKLHSQKEWWQYCKSGDKPEDIPSHPELAYKADGWSGWKDWLGATVQPRERMRRKALRKVDRRASS